MARRRHLSPEEQALWRAVAKTARALHEDASPVPGEAEGRDATSGSAAGGTERGSGGQAIGAQVPEDFVLPQAQMPKFRLGERALAPQRVGLPSPASEALRMDARTHQRMIRGRMVPEARIDLHGMTLAEAHPELIAFLVRARARGLRLVLVITGKGKTVHEPVPRPVGALRHQVPHWLRLQPLAGLVQQVSEAHLKHGGAGAYYVWLRRL